MLLFSFDKAVRDKRKQAMEEHYNEFYSCMVVECKQYPYNIVYSGRRTQINSLTMYKKETPTYKGFITIVLVKIIF